MERRSWPQGQNVLSLFQNTKRLVVTLLLSACISLLIGGLIPSAQYWGMALATCIITFAVFATLKALSDKILAVQANVAELPIAVSRTLPSELHAMQVILRRFPECSIPTSIWSMRFTNLLTLLDTLDEQRPKVVVEFGSGISTLLVAAWMRENSQGWLISFDHDPSWAEITRRFLQQEGLASYARVVDAPLTTVHVPSGTFEWYHISSTSSELKDIDLLIVDGPPAGVRGKWLSRLPALEYLHPKLSPACTVLLDDALRPGETAVVDRWKNQFPEFEALTIHTTTGIAILSRGRSVATDDGKPEKHDLAEKGQSS